MDKDDFCKKKGQLNIFVKVTSTWFVSIYILLVYIVSIYCWYILLAYIVGIYIFQPDLLAYRFRSHRPRPSICEPGFQRKVVITLLPCKMSFVFA